MNDYRLLIASLVWFGVSALLWIYNRSITKSPVAKAATWYGLYLAFVFGLALLLRFTLRIL